MHTFEIPVFSAAAARTAVARGATRLELNRAGSYADGGVTPSLAEVADVRRAIMPAGSTSTPVPLRIMIRPRGPPPSAPGAADAADFIYSDAEFRHMQASIAAFVASGLLSPADGFVFGILEADTNGLQLDAERNRLLVEAAGAHACVLHRAFDLVVDAAAPGASLAAARAIGFAGVLTAGGPGRQGAVGHVGVLRGLVSCGAGLEVIVGGGVRSSNMQVLAGILGEAVHQKEDQAKVAFHSSCLADAAAAMREGAMGEAVDGDEVGRMHLAVSQIGNV